MRPAALLASAALVLTVAACASPTGPAAAAPSALRTIALRNPGFESPPRPGERCALNWDCTMHADPDAFRFRLESAAPGAGERSLCIERVTHEPWALATQFLQDDALRGRRLRFSLAVRADRIDGRGVGAWVLVQGVPPAQGHFERLVPRTDGWQRVAVEFTVPTAATMMEVGAVLEGGGRACFDEARLELIE